MTAIQLNPDYLQIHTDYGVSYGGQQDWYRSFWQRQAGCGPTTGSTIYMYSERLRGADGYDIAQFRKLMQTMWSYITPGMRGVDSVERFAGGYQEFAREHQLAVATHMLTCAPDDQTRPRPKEVFDFLAGALKNQCAVGFLNLDHGQEKRLESWHWVVLVGVDYNPQSSSLAATIVDSGRLQTLDLGLWLATTRQGGGFVYFESEAAPQTG